jgi:hypothetical protein
MISFEINFLECKRLAFVLRTTLKLYHAPHKGVGHTSVTLPTPGEQKVKGKLVGKIPNQNKRPTAKQAFRHEFSLFFRGNSWRPPRAGSPRLQQVKAGSKPAPSGTFSLLQRAFTWMSQAFQRSADADWPITV